MIKKFAIGLAVVVGLSIAYYLISPIFRVIKVDEPSPVQGLDKDDLSLVNEPSRAAFIASQHDVQGEALIITFEEMKILRFENFKTIDGPDLRIYLSADLDGKDYIDLGPIKATEGNVNYELPTGVDLNKYNKVLVWCRAFRVLFSYAQFGS